MQNPLVSIIVPVYHVEKYLPQCLDSLVNQTYRHIEIIAVNDGSPDNSLSVLSTYAEKDSRIKIINQKNAGVSQARNRGLESACGEYLVFVDGDDWLELHTIEKALSCIEDTRSDVVLFSYIREFEDQSLARYLLKEDFVYAGIDYSRLYRRIVGLTGDELSDPAIADILGTVWGKLYRTSFIQEGNIRFTDLKVIGCAEDVLFNICLFARMKQAAYLHACFYHYRKFNESSITSVYRASLPVQWKALFQRIQSLIDDFGLDETFQTALNNRIALSIIGLGLNECDSSDSSAVKVQRLLRILASDRYRISYKSLSLSHFPLHWKLFFFCAKYHCAWGVYILLLCIKKIIKR